MKALLELIKNPRVAIFAVAHWMLALYLIIEPFTKEILTKKSSVSFSGSNAPTWQENLSAAIFAVDLPAIIPAALLWSPIYILDDWGIFSKGVIFTSLFTITLEWLIIGKIVFNIFSKFESQMTTLSLKDE